MKKIIHVDADCFYAAIELRDKPHLEGLPIAVGGNPDGRGVIATCNYVARSYGVRSAMASANAKRLCPELIFITPDMAKYKMISSQMFEVLTQYTDRIQTVSLDEAYLDVTDSPHCLGSATLIARDIQSRIMSDLGLSVSAGVAPLKFLAKVASDWKKPAGIFTVSPDMVSPFIANLDLRKLPGVGPRTWQKLLRLGLHTCSDILNAEPSILVGQFGAFAGRLISMARGIDQDSVSNERSRRSLSVEHTFGQDFHRAVDLVAELPPLLSQLEQRYTRLDLSKNNQALRIDKRTVKLRFADFSHTSIEAKIGRFGEVLALSEFERLAYIARQRNSLPVRLLGVGLKVAETETLKQLELPLSD